MNLLPIPAPPTFRSADNFRARDLNEQSLSDELLRLPAALRRREELEATPLASNLSGQPAALPCA
ncbi:hypothetical protein GCM10012289_62060 [Nonomuraea cavernae]|uniref:Uncharacterized protein n=1 Tax=Nonomuraea cavernae TaxID=2045107 RepID=A0A917ZC18_9ACTN|nr:hypothetical protein GCM10012289_62060 [Nonomuraea cavernae]